MATIKKPLVADGQGGYRELASSESLQSADHPQLLNNTGGTLIPGTPVYKNGVTNEVAKGIATAFATSDLIGLTTESISNGTTGGIATDGILSLSTGQWDAVAGTTGGLTAGTRYYLSTTAGLITSTIPTGSGQVQMYVGKAINTTDLNITLGYPLLLA